MADREEIPDKIILENSALRARTRLDKGPDGVKFREADFSADTKAKIGEYFQQTIPEKTNSSTAAIKDGPNLGVFVGNDPNSNSHLSKQATDIKTNFEKTGNAGYFTKEVIPGDAGDINTETQIQASNLLTGLGGKPELLAEETSATIAENALFGPDNVFVGPNGPAEGDAGTKEHVIQSRLGDHSPSRLFKTTEKDATLSIKKLRNIAHQILLESSGEHYVPDDPSDITQQFLARTAATAAPGTARLGFRVDANRFGASELINKGNTFSKSGGKFGLKEGAKASFGSVNNYLIPFSAISSDTSSIVVGTLLVKTFSLIFSGLAKSLSKFSPRGVETISPVPDGPSNLDIRRRRLGNHIPKNIEEDPAFGLVLLGLEDNLLVSTISKYEEAVNAGLESFFGTGVTKGLSVDGAPTKIVEASGFYNGILRLLVRSVSDPLSSVLNLGQNLPVPVGGAAGGLGTAFSSGAADYQPITRPASDPASIADTIKLIKESRFLKFMNTMASLGDIILHTSDDSSLESRIDNQEDSIKEAHLGDDLQRSTWVPDPSSLIKKNRLSDTLGSRYKNTLAWNANTLPSLYMINNSVLRAEAGFGNSNNYNALASRRSFATTDNKRLSAYFVKETEARLDTYYMPFYFHDLRTNEIISFHAFIDSISDSHSAEYNESEGYGRIGKIYTYKNTNRTISLSFKVVSTSADGFDEMWFKLNKILMMLYPQYTLGRELSYNGKKFIQPFSQLPSASPMIRLRVGDLIKTNFSEFDLARLFGLGSDSFDLTNGSPTYDAQLQINIRREYIRIKERQKGISTNGIPTFNPGEQFVIKRNIQTIGNMESHSSIRRTTDPHSGETRQERNSRRRTQAAEQRQWRHRHGRIPPPPQVPINSVATVVGKVEDYVYRITFTPSLAGEQNGTVYEINFKTQENTNNYQPVEFDINEPAVYAAARTAAQPTTQTSSTPDDQPWQKVSEFFSTAESAGGTTRPETPQERASDGQTSGVEGALTGPNPIFKSFETTQGKGLAGFIKSISFNWEGAIWETTDVGSKAPKWCTVQMEFAPVHDLNPGIDVNGNMISPIYNIGSVLKQMKVRRAERSANENTPPPSTTNNSQ